MGEPTMRFGKRELLALGVLVVGRSVPASGQG
jgi:hypothetical protein